MNETYLIMAKTVEEAIAIANREYAKDGKEVSYEILEMPKKGFLGIGARDAKIKITVTESESSKIGSELNSIVADLRGMKVHTNRGGSGSDSDEKPKKQGQKKPQNGQGPKKPAEKSDKAQAQNGQKPARPQGQKPQQNPTKSEGKPAEPKKPQEPRQPKEPKPQNHAPKSAEPKHSSEPKQDKPQRPVAAEPKKPQEAKPKSEQQKHEKQEPRQPRPERQPKSSAEPKPSSEPKEPKAEPKPAEKPAKPEPVAEPVKGPVVETLSEGTAEPAAEPAKHEYKSSLRNQAKPQRRQNRPKSPNADAVPGAEAIIASPVGLADFTREANGEAFGSETSGSGRMSNDIRKKPRQPRREIVAAEAPLAEIPAEEAAEASAPVMDAAADEELSAIPMEEAVEAAESAESMEEAESEAEAEAEVPVVEEDRQKVGVTEAEMQYALDFTNTLLKNMAIGATASRAECPEGEEYVIEGDANVYPKINIDGDGTGILIGHHGETLDAVQYLVNLAALRQSKQKGGDYVKIVVDIENYRAKREETLRSLARRMAARAVKYKRNVFLEPMNAYERRIIHSELHSFENVSTHSVGADKNRKIIITYEGPDKAQQPRREREDRAERTDRGESKSESRGSASRRGENRRPKKIQKMPIEKLPDFLASGTTPDDDTFIEIED